MRPERRDTRETEFKVTVPIITTKLLEFLIPIFYFLNVPFPLLILFCLFSAYFFENTKKAEEGSRLRILFHLLSCMDSRNREDEGKIKGDSAVFFNSPIQKITKATLSKYLSAKHLNFPTSYSRFH